MLPSPRNLLRLPRTRGDGPATISAIIQMFAAAPHARGWTSAWERSRGSEAGCPARAGMDPLHTGPEAAPDGLPRTRGDGP